MQSRSFGKVGKATKIPNETSDPSIFLSDNSSLLDQIKEEWDIAERNIKKAENVQGDLCLPAVNELRYAGRRLIDAWEAVRKNDYEEALAKINDAKFDCYRARHDSIDAISSKIAKDIAITVDAFNVDVVIRAFSSYSDFLHLLFEIQGQIESSRGDRKNRSAIYSTVEGCNIDALIDYYRRFRTAENIMVDLAEQAKRDIGEKRFYEHGGFWIGVAGFVVGVVGLVAAFVK